MVRAKSKAKKPTVLAEVAEVKEGQVELPVDRSQVEELVGAFAQLSVIKQDYLITRFPHCDSDREAVELCQRSSPELTYPMVDHWKRDDEAFAVAYKLLSGRLIDWAKYLASSIEAGNALLGALENRKLLLMPWEGLGSREATAKSQAGNAAMDRILGRKDKLEVSVISVEQLTEGLK